MEFVRRLVLQCLCAAIVIYPVWRSVRIADKLPALGVGAHAGAGSWLQFERHRRVGDSRRSE